MDRRPLGAIRDLIGCFATNPDCRRDLCPSVLPLQWVMMHWRRPLRGLPCSKFRTRDPNCPRCPSILPTHRACLPRRDTLLAVIPQLEPSPRMRPMAFNISPHHRWFRASCFVMAWFVIGIESTTELQRSFGQSETSEKTSQTVSGMGGGQTRPTRDPNQLRHWLENMVWHHRYSRDEILNVTGLNPQSLDAALLEFNVQPDNQPQPEVDPPMMVLPYPEGQNKDRRTSVCPTRRTQDSSTLRCVKPVRGRRQRRPRLRSDCLSPRPAGETSLPVA